MNWSTRPWRLSYSLWPPFKESCGFDSGLRRTNDCGLPGIMRLRCSDWRNYGSNIGQVPEEPPAIQRQARECCSRWHWLSSAGLLFMLKEQGYYFLLIRLILRPTNTKFSGRKRAHLLKCISEGFWSSLYL